MRNSLRVIVGLLVLGLAIVCPSNAITCQEAVMKIAPCQLFLTGHSDITPFCCDAVQSLNTDLVTRDDRKAVCECFKQVARAIGVIDDKARKIPQLCGLVLAVPIDSSTDCNVV